MNGDKLRSVIYMPSVKSVCTGLPWREPSRQYQLTRGLVWGDRAAEHIEQHPREPVDEARVPTWVYRGESEPDPALIEVDMMTIKNVMWHYVGLIRTAERLARAERELASSVARNRRIYRSQRLNDALIGLT